MEQQLYAIRDTKGDFFNKPFPQITKAEALRTFQDLTRDPQSTVNKHPEDYDLYYLGTYETVSGKITALKSPEHIAKAIHMLAKDPAPKNLEN